MFWGQLRRVTARGRLGLRRHQERVQLTRPERSAGPKQRHSFRATATPTSGTFCHPNESTCHPRSSHSRSPTPPGAPNLLSVSAGLSVLDTTEGEPCQRLPSVAGFFSLGLFVSNARGCWRPCRNSLPLCTEWGARCVRWAAGAVGAAPAFGRCAWCPRSAERARRSLRGFQTLPAAPCPL